MIGTNEKCLFATKSKIEINQLDMFCQKFNATVPYPNNNEENQNYRHAFKLMNTSTSIAVKSRHGIVELDQNGNWNPFPTSRLVNVACEKTLLAQTARTKRRAKRTGKNLK